jgi:hypothetical protein
MQPHPPSRFLPLALSALFLPLPARPAPAQSAEFQFVGDAYGSFANVADRVVAGQSFPVFMGPCGTLRPPLSGSNTGASVTARPQVATGAIDTTASATDDGTPTSTTSSTVHAVNVLAGLITGDVVRSVSATSHDRAGFHTSADGSRLVNLRVAGAPVMVVPAPNTRINLAGFGYVVLNEQISTIQSTNASLVVNMIHVVVTLPNALVPVGTNVIVAHAKSRLISTSIAGILGGFAYGSFARQGNLLVSGQSALVPLGCHGTNGAVKTNSVATVDLQPAFDTGIVTNTASGLVTSASASGETTSTVEAVSLLSSLVTADAIRADAHSFTDGNTFTFTDTGTSFVNLSVSGFPDIRDDVSANTRVSLQGLGDMWLKREIFGPNSIEIRMIEIVVTQANVQGIPIGTHVLVGVARASAH